MQAQNVRAQFEALLLQPILRPLEEAFGPYGDLGAQAFAQALARGFERGDG
ncbi:MAG TPA: hypothetical protein VFE17_03615 [Candidatus Baltobacteraceae bacterium]|jgi:hypothetical protein|nr:hypothetical protein [Candidatus Baltobacteraceae bacterium]